MTRDNHCASAPASPRKSASATASARPDPIVVAAPGCMHRLANPIETVPDAALTGAGVVLIADPDGLADAVVRLRARGVDRILPVNSGAIDVDGDIERALQTLAATGARARTPSASLMRAGRACAVKFPADTFGALQPGVEKLARLAGAPVEFVAGALLAAVSGISTGRFVVKVREGFDVAPIGWIALVGDASSQKSPAMDAIVRIVRKIESDYRRLNEQQIETAKKDGTKLRDVPPARRAIVTNSSIEQLGHICAGQSRGMLCFYDELSEWFSSLRRYSKSATGDRGSWLRAHNGHTDYIDRRSLDQPLHIPCWGLAVLGAIPPSVLSALAQSAELENGDGLDARLWYLYPQQPPVQIRPDPHDGGAESEFEKMFRRLFEWRVMAAGAHTIEFDHEAREKFETWRYHLLTQARHQGAAEVSSWTGKLPGTVARLAGLIALIDAAAAGVMPGSINVDQLRRAAQLSEIFTAHRAKVELERGAPAIERIAAELAGFIVTHNVKVIDTFEIRKLVAGVRAERNLRLCLLELQAAGWLSSRTFISPRADDTLPALVDINPAVFDLARRSIQ